LSTAGLSFFYSENSFVADQFQTEKQVALQAQTQESSELVMRVATLQYLSS